MRPSPAPPPPVLAPPVRRRRVSTVRLGRQRAGGASRGQHAGARTGRMTRVALGWSRASRPCRGCRCRRYPSALARALALTLEHALAPTLEHALAQILEGARPRCAAWPWWTGQWWRGGRPRARCCGTTARGGCIWRRCRLRRPGRSLGVAGGCAVLQGRGVVAGCLALPPSGQS